MAQRYTNQSGQPSNIGPALVPYQFIMLANGCEMTLARWLFETRPNVIFGIMGPPTKAKLFSAHRFVITIGSLSYEKVKGLSPKYV